MTDHSNSDTVSMAGLQRLCETLGADRSRWPARERLRYSGFIAEHAPARRMLAEALALDALLDRAPEPARRDVDALASRILLAAAEDAAGRGRVVRMPDRVHSRRRTVHESTLGWPAAAMLAASLMLGIFAGWSGHVDGPMQSIASLASGQDGMTDGEDDTSGLAFGNDDGDDITGVAL
ncbi:MAG: hypothetical protein ACT4N2_14970 [Hyphomicrobium sp.]